MTGRFLASGVGHASACLSKLPRLKPLRHKDASDASLTLDFTTPVGVSTPPWRYTTALYTYFAFTEEKGEATEATGQNPHGYRVLNCLTTFDFPEASEARTEAAQPPQPFS